MGDISVSLDKVQLDRVLTKGQELSPTFVAQAMMGIAQLMLRDATMLAPWDTRTLIKSATIMPPEMFGTSTTIKFGFGGAASVYAEIQHDRYPNKRKPGRQWHYLTDPVTARAYTIGPDIVKLLEANLR